MKNRFLFLLVLAITLCACTSKTDPFFGTWTVSKVNVQFDEQLSTPELVKQVGEMEKQNVIKISSDSILTFKGLDIEWQDRISLKNETLLRNGAVFGTWKTGKSSPAVIRRWGKLLLFIGRSDYSSTNFRL